jgi:hypothetical protein
MPGMNESKELVYMARLDAAGASPLTNAPDDEVNIYEYLSYLLLKVRQNRFQIDLNDADILALQNRVTTLEAALANLMDHGVLFFKFTIQENFVEKAQTVDLGTLPFKFTISAEEQKTTIVQLTLTPSGTDVQES